MRRICFVGNSHVAAIKQAVDALKGSGSLSNVEVSIFGSNGTSLKSARVKNGIIMSDDEFVRQKFHWTSGGRSEIRVADYDDIFVLVGRSLFDCHNFRSASDIPVVSSALADDIMARLWAAWPIMLAREAAKSNENVRVSHIGNPFISSESPEAKAILSKFYDDRSGFSERAAKIKAMIAVRVAETSPANFRVVGPPPAALDASGLFTQHAFCQGSVRLSTGMNVAHPTDDFSHMNVGYGKLVLQHLGVSVSR